MKPIGIFIVVLLIVVLIYLYLLNKKAKEYASTKPGTINNYNGGYELGLGLANLIANTKCGKEGRPPCTKAELEASGWTPEQIASAEAGSTAISNWSLCYNLGVNC